MEKILEDSRTTDLELQEKLAHDMGARTSISDEGRKSLRQRAKSLRSEGKQVMMKVTFHDQDDGYDVSEDIVDKKSALRTPKLIGRALTVFLGVNNYMMAMCECLPELGSSAAVTCLC
jgi:hypothetical protein